MQEEIQEAKQAPENNKRIVKNTLLLYFRMLLMMGVSLFTVRIVLDTLGTVDYGLYNVIGGVVSMLAVLSGTMSNASQRFFAYELGRKDDEQLKKTFSMTLLIYVMLCVVILLLAETVGLWFLNHKMTIPDERMNAARWVYQFSVLSFIITMFRTPYNAVIIAHEKMNVYAYVSIIEVVLKLVIVYLLILFSIDKLKLYAVLMFGVTALVALIYMIYSRRKFEEAKFSYYWNASLFKEILSFSGWNLFGGFASVFRGQGINIILNIFFGPVVNAARGIAFQVSNAINQFVQNFMTAANPQIIKYYAANEKKQLNQLIFRSSKLSYLLLFVISMPILLETKFIFTLWLKEIPEYVIVFTRLIIINAMIDSFSYPLMTAAQATGKIKKYQSLVGGIMILNLPASYLLLKLGYLPQSVFYVGIIIATINLFVRLFLLKKMIGLPIIDFLTQILLRLLMTSVLAYIIPFLLFTNMDYGIWRFFVVAIAGVIMSSTIIYLLGLAKDEKKFILQMIANTKQKFYK